MGRVVENRESTARDHLANERTLLAWVRTALGLMGLGVMVAKFVQTEGPSAELVGMAFVGFGALMLLYGLYRYFRITSLLMQGKYAVASWGPLVLGLLALVVAVGATIVVMR
jgi:putative membrane protein